MKHFLLPLFYCIVILSCKKENTNPTLVESSSQQLTKISCTGNTGSIVYTVSYKFDNAGNIMKEGNKTYVRDEQHRIIKILNADPDVNRPETDVYYSNANPDAVAYTFCQLPAINATDSTVYLHDDKGRLVKTMTYLSYFASKDTPDTMYVCQYDIFGYDTAGNLVQMDDFKISYYGEQSHCGEYLFDDYDKNPNPLFTGDEVRTMEVSCESMLNTSQHNATTAGSYSIVYDYRADGRPRSCIVQQGGKNVSKLLFEYQ